MQTEKALVLDDFLKIAIQFFFDTVSEEARLSIHYVNYESSLTEEAFREAQEDFEKELTENILLYKDKEIIRTYIIKCLGELLSWQGMSSSINDEIMDSGYNIQFLFELKKEIEKWMKRLREITGFGSSIPMSFDIFFNSVVGNNAVDNPDLDESNDDKPVFDERFDFDTMLEECRIHSADFISQIEFIHDRLADLKNVEITKF